jgi:hypothetical protein
MLSLPSRSWPEWLLKYERVLFQCSQEFYQLLQINNSEACFSPTSPSSKLSSIQVVGSMGGRPRHQPRVVDSIEGLMLTLLLIISSLSFLFTTLQFVYHTFIHISFRHSINCFIHITSHLFKSWHACAALLLHHLLSPAPRGGDNLSTPTLSMTLSPQYWPITLTHMMTIQNPMTSLFCDHPQKPLSSSHQNFHSVNTWKLSHNDTINF